MIICSDTPLNIGEVITQGLVSDRAREYVRVSFQVLGVASRQEYEACALEYAGVSETEHKPYYYRVSID